MNKTTLHKNDIPANFKASSQIMAIDTETMGLNLDRDRLCVFQFSFGDGEAHIVQFTHDTNYEATNLKKFLENPEIVKVFHYARFDILAIKKYLGVSLENIYCTKIASRLARTYTQYHSLKSLVMEVCGVKMDKFQQSSDWGQEELSRAQIEYAAYDVLYLHEVKKKLDEMLIREDRMHIAQDCFAFLPTRVELDDLGWGEFDIFQHSDDTK
jgi:ribonuclease D